MNTTEFLAEQKGHIGASPAMKHPFLDRFARGDLDEGAMRNFAIQWYKTARAHKRAFPSLVTITEDDDIRFDLIEILRDEYGNGDRERIHARLLGRCLDRLGISERDVDATRTLPEVESFSQRVRESWSGKNQVRAFGVHFALELLATRLHESFARGMEKYPSLSPEDREYFEYHRTAEKEHADYSEPGFLRYAESPENRKELERGVAEGIDLLMCLYDGLSACLWPQVA